MLLTHLINIVASTSAQILALTIKRLIKIPTNSFFNMMVRKPTKLRLG